MTSIAHPATWSGITRLGEATLLLPLAAGSCAALWRQPAWRPLVRRWLGALLPATVLTTASKVAFMGWGLGSARLDFTGISGHAMFASALLPVLAHLAHGVWRGTAAQGPEDGSPTGHGSGIWPGAWIGAALALLVGVSRVQVGAHSWSEVLLGLLAGAAVSAWTLAGRPGRGALPWRRGAVAVLALALPLAMVWAPPSRTHDWVTRLALEVSGRREPWQRWQLKARRSAAAADPRAERPTPGLMPPSALRRDPAPTAPGAG